MEVRAPDLRRTRLRCPDQPVTGVPTNRIVSTVSTSLFLLISAGFESNVGLCSATAGRPTWDGYVSGTNIRFKHNGMEWSAGTMRCRCHGPGQLQHKRVTEESVVVLKAFSRFHFGYLLTSTVGLSNLGRIVAEQVLDVRQALSNPSTAS